VQDSHYPGGLELSCTEYLFLLFPTAFEQRRGALGEHIRRDILVAVAVAGCELGAMNCRADRIVSAVSVKVPV
jgi:hypothetical protein